MTRNERVGFEVVVPGATVRPVVTRVECGKSYLEVKQCHHPTNDRWSVHTASGALTKGPEGFDFYVGHDAAVKFAVRMVRSTERRRLLHEQLNRVLDQQDETNNENGSE